MGWVDGLTGWVDKLMGWVDRSTGWVDGLGRLVGDGVNNITYDVPNIINIIL